MTAGTDMFGDVAQLATALGVLGSDGSISTDFFADPAGTMSDTLRDATRRQALLSFLDDVLGDSAPQVDEAGATWTPIFQLTDPVRLYLVTAQVATGITIGVGVRGATSGSPSAEGHLSLPLLLMPTSGPIVFLPGSTSPAAVAELAAQVEVGSPSLQSVGITAAMPVGSGATGDLTVTVAGLTVPGSDTPLNLTLDSSAAIGPQLLHVVSTLIETELQAAAADIGAAASTLLGLLGLAPDSVVPLPLADLAVRGLPALQDWLGQLADSDAALQAWFTHLAQLLGATTSGPFQADLTLTTGVDLTVGLVVDTDATGGRRFAPTLGLTATVATDTAVELTATLCQVSIGAHPGIVALPSLECHARYGAASGTSTILDHTDAGIVVRVGALRAGIGLDAGRHPVFVLAADRVDIGPVASPTTQATLDLTSPDALADVGGEALSGVLGTLISGLGAAGTALSELLGLSVPASWTAGGWPAVNAAALIANPVSAWLGFQRSVIDLGSAAFADLLSSAAGLLGKPAVASAAGTAADPWILASTGDLALIAWTVVAGSTTALHVGARWLPSATAIGGADGPTPSLTLLIDTLAIPLPTTGVAVDLHVLPAVQISAGLSSPAGHPLRITLGPAAIAVPGAAATFSWTTAAGASASFELPGATLTVDTTTVPLALPTIDSTGALVLPPGIDDHLLETLLGQLLAQVNAPWPTALVQALGLGSSTAGGDPFANLLTDPRGWLAARLRSLLSEADPGAVDGALASIAAAMAALIGVPATATAPVVAHALTPATATGPAGVSGTGRPDDPLVIPLQAGPAALEVAVWLDPAGPPIPANLLTSLLQPAALTSWLSADGAALTSADLVQLLTQAGASVPGLAELLDGRDAIAAGWDAITARTTGGDGLLPGGAPDISGATASTLAGIAHTDLPAHLDLTSLAGLPNGTRTLFITGPYAPAWFDTAIPTLDLSTPTLADTAFDTTALAAGAGPWHIRLPYRDDCPGANAASRAAACASRLTRAITAAASSGSTVLLVAHGPAAAGTARLVATTGAPVAGLVLLGANSAAVPLDILDQPPMADALALARRLLPADSTHDSTDLALARSFISELATLFDATRDPAVDLTPPAGLAAPAVPTWSVRGVLDAVALGKAFGAVVQAGLAAFTPGTGPVDNPGAPAAAAPIALRAGLRMHLPLPAATTTDGAEGVSLDVVARLDFGGLPLATGAAIPPPALQLDVEIYRQAGWLAGGPAGTTPTPGVLRTPSLRRAKISVGADLASGVRGARATITLTEAAALGVSRDAWVLGTDGEALGPETRVLLGRLAAAFGPVPPTGPITAITDLLTAFGLSDPTTARPAFGLSVDAVQQLLIDPTHALEGALTGSTARSAAADALRRLIGATGTAGAVDFDLGDVTVGIDLAATPIALSVATTGIALGGGPTLTCSAHVDLAGNWGGTAALGSAASSYGSPGIELALGTSPALALTFGVAPAGVPARIPLYPPLSTGQLAGIAAVALSAAEAAAMRMLVTELRSAVLSASQLTNFDPVLTALGLLSGSGNAAAEIAPFGLVGDPIGYLAKATGWSSGAAPAANVVADLLDGLRGMLGLPSAAHGVLPISTSIALSASAAPTGGLKLALGYAGTEGELAATLDAGITLLTAGAPVPHLDLGVGLAGQLPRVDLALDGPTLSVQLHTSGGDIALLPSGPGLGSLANTAVQQALPYVLNTLHDNLTGAIPTALAAARTVLGLGATSFDAAQLQMLAANPGAELVRRLTAYGATAFSELQSMLPTLPAPWTVTAGASNLRVGYGAQWVEVRLAGAPKAFTVETSITSDLPGITGATLSLDAVVDTSGLRSITASGQLAPADALAIGPLSLAPVVEVSIGPDAAPPRVQIGLVVAAGTGTRSALLSIDLNPVAVSLRTRTGTTDDPTADPGVIVTHVLVPLVADAALHESHVHDLLATAVGGTTLSGLLNGVLLTSTGDFDTGLLALDPADLSVRLVTLIANLANAVPPLALPENLQLSFTDGATKRGLAITVQAGERADLTPQSDDIALAIEVDDSWVSPTVSPPGLSIMIVETSGTPRFIPPLITIDGVGLRLYRRSGALLDTGISIGSIGLFSLLKIDASGPGVTDGGLAFQLDDLAIAPASATGGSNGVAQGILGNAGQTGGGGDNTGLKPQFSPELSLQKRQGDSDFEWSLTAGPGTGPWMVHIGRSFGPLRVDDVGFGDDITNNKVTAIRIIISGGISLAGLNLDVQDLSIGAPWPGSGGKALTDPSAWSLDLDGLAVSYSGGGVQLAGGLRRRDNPSFPGKPPDYVGMLLARVGPYGLTAFGGYGQFPSPTGNFTALFVFAAINAPLGGPPAFFVTGLGGGAGINRALVLPTELNDFASFPMIAALDPQSTLASDPEHAMDLLSSSFPPQQGTYWFAAGVSFTSFALVDVVAVVAIEVGDGFAVTLLGLARAALPTTYLPLVQLELALMAHFSTSEGILEVRAQLTDNSFLLTRDCRLTGGFAYVSWFGSNPNAGQFVLSIGGYHPSFHRDDYPVVPRVGYRWDVLGCLTITGQSYFALTSEAIMAGTSFTAALDLGPIWASLALGVDAIVYFDPFHFQASGYATIAAGITFSVDLLFGTVTVTLSFHLGATVEVDGPDFHGSASIDLDVTSATISFGSSTDGSTPPLGWAAFAQKYLTGGGGKPVLSAAVRAGAITPAGGASPDGSVANPWLLVPEFSFSVMSTAASNNAAATTGNSGAVPVGGAGWTVASFAVDGALGIAPMQLAGVESWLGVSIVSPDGAEMPVPVFTGDPAAQGISVALVTAPMPKGVWAAQLASGAIPTGETITAGTGLTVTIAAEITAGSPPINYADVAPGTRQPLPFGIEATVRPGLDSDAANAAAFASAAGSNATTLLSTAQGYLDSGRLESTMTPLANATFRRDRVAPPRIALLTEGIAPPNSAAPTLMPIVPPVTVPLNTTVEPPLVTAFLGGGTIGQQRSVQRTTASTFATAPVGVIPLQVRAAESIALTPRVSAPTVASVTAGLDPALGARLTRTAPLAQPVVRLTSSTERSGGLVAVDGGPVTRRAGAPLEVQQLAGAAPAAAALLSAHESAFTSNGTTLRPGEVLVTTLPNHERDLDQSTPRPTITVSGDATVRVVAVSAMGEVLADQTATASEVAVPSHTARLVLWCLGGSSLDAAGKPISVGASAGLAGWVSTDRLPFVGAGVTLGRDAVITGLAAPRRGHRNAEAAHHLVATPASDSPVVRTTLPPITSVIVVSLDAGSAADLSGLTVGITGATRPLDGDGNPAPPIVVTAHGRTHLAYDVEPSANQQPVVVSIGTDSDWSLVGVMGGVTSAAAIANLLATGGAAGLLAPLLQAPTGQAQVRWSGSASEVSMTDNSIGAATSTEQGVH
jgi:hypothetical protein